ncbi:MAG: isoprenylcysteine carboxylmethyltransferase family protein [Acidobacteria bacterium]|nr:isoprenylcysteine carboxylmethyltransferase family protein [Acidobacteriota bacterium]MBI3663099.1 isoprenylcysteine carboxylmethyltransferase family protein [Acidobacteriota bacterium]
MLLLLRILWLPSAVLAVTLGWIGLDRAMGWHGLQLLRVGRLLVLLGLVLAVWCAALFLLIGKGSPHPFVVKTKHLVTSGPYRYVRNPMMWGVGSIITGLAFWLGSVGLWFGFACFLLFVRCFVPGYEERDMERRFGEEYREYCRRVPRWWPRFSRPKTR